MSTINICAAKANFSRLVEEAGAGAEIIITKRGKPMARLVPLEPIRKTVRLGLLAGTVKIPDDFDDPLPDHVLKLFLGG